MSDYPPVYYPNLYPENPEKDSLLDNGDVERGDNVEQEEQKSRCMDYPDDWDYPLHDKYSCRATWSLVIALIALFTTLWPLSIISLCLIRKVKKTVRCGHRHSCKVYSAWLLSILGTVLGILEWIALAVLVYEKYRQ